MENDDLERGAAAAQLAALQADRDELADRTVQPWWYDTVLSLLLFGFISSYALDNTWISLVALVVFLLCLRGMMALYRRLNGFWVDGFRKGRTRRAIVVWVGLVLVVLSLGFVGHEHWRGTMVVVGAVLAVGLFLVNQWWGRLYVSELRGQR